jgi:hypothetical protein
MKGFGALPDWFATHARVGNWRGKHSGKPATPFVVTLLGGIIVTMASQLWQEHAAQLNFERLSWTEAMKKRRTAAREFANHIDGALYTLQVFKRREFWLRAHIHELPNFIFPDGRDFNEERGSLDVWPLSTRCGSRLNERSSAPCAILHSPAVSCFRT